MATPARRSHGGILLATLFLATMPTALLGQNGSRRSARAPRIPAISGVVVDALTGQPIGGVDVVLRASLGVASIGDGGEEPLRYESNTTSANGGFRFPGRREPRAAGLFSSISEISLSVNRVFVSVAQMRSLSPTERGRTSDGLSDVTWLAQHGTLGDANFTNNPGSEFPFGRLDNRSYFPVSVQFLRDCNYEWAATCLSLSPTANVRIPLIPVLNDPADCAKITDPESQQRCRQLNTYRAAFLHRETIAQVREGKRLCESVDEGRASRQCLEHLHNDVRLRRTPQRNLMPLPGMESIENALIPGPIGGLVAASPGVSSLDLFEGTVTYGTRYRSSATPSGLVPILALVNVFNTDASSKDIADWIAVNGSYRGGTERNEILDGNQIRDIERSTSSIVIWNSGRRIIILEFERPSVPPQFAREVDAVAAGWPDLIRAYLRKYPSSL